MMTQDKSEYIEISDFFHGFALAKQKDGRVVVIDEKFNQIPLRFDDSRKYPLAEQTAREEIVRIGRLLYERNYNVTIDGNISLRLSENEFLFTPSGKHKGFLTPDELIVIDLDGNSLRGEGKASCEYRLHTFIYRRRPDINAVLHVHSPHATAASLAGISLEKTWISMAPVPTTEYARIGSEQSPLVIEPFVEDYNWAILPRHGPVTWADTLWNAFLRLEGLEHLAHIVMLAHGVSNITPMTQEQRQELLKFWNLEHLDKDHE